MAGGELGGGSVMSLCLFMHLWVLCVVWKSQTPPVEEKNIYRLLSAGCHSFPRASPIHHFLKNLSSPSHMSLCLSDATPALRAFGFPFPPWRILSCPPYWAGSTGWKLSWGKERRGGGSGSSVTPSQDCCPCSLCVWGRAFASAQSAADGGNGLIRNCMQCRQDRALCCVSAWGWLRCIASRNSNSYPGRVSNMRRLSRHSSFY